MQWSKLKCNVESRFAPSVQGKIHLYTTNYGCNCGRAWITYNGEQIANFETILNLNRIHREKEPTNDCGHVDVDSSERKPAELLSRGEMSRWDLHKACYAFLNMSIEDAVDSANPIIQSLAFLDQRFGKRRVLDAAAKELHPLARKLLDIRITEDNHS